MVSKALSIRTIYPQWHSQYSPHLYAAHCNQPAICSCYTVRGRGATDAVPSDVGLPPPRRAPSLLPALHVLSALPVRSPSAASRCVSLCTALHNITCTSNDVGGHDGRPDLLRPCAAQVTRHMQTKAIPASAPGDRTPSSEEPAPIKMTNRQHYKLHQAKLVRTMATAHFLQPRAQELRVVPTVKLHACPT